MLSPAELVDRSGSVAALRSAKKPVVAQSSKGMGVKTPDDAVFEKSLLRALYDTIALADLLVQTDPAYKPPMDYYMLRSTNTLQKPCLS